jgi:hypothetical protein
VANATVHIGLVSAGLEALRNRKARALNNRERAAIPISFGGLGGGYGVGGVNAPTVLKTITKGIDAGRAKLAQQKTVDTALVKYLANPTGQTATAYLNARDDMAGKTPALPKFFSSGAATTDAQKQFDALAVQRFNAALADYKSAHKGAEPPAAKKTALFKDQVKKVAADVKNAWKQGSYDPAAGFLTGTASGAAAPGTVTSLNPIPVSYSTSSGNGAGQSNAAAPPPIPAAPASPGDDGALGYVQSFLNALSGSSGPASVAAPGAAAAAAAPSSSHAALIGGAVVVVAVGALAIALLHHRKRK